MSMKRREFMGRIATTALLASAPPFAAMAQGADVLRIGIAAKGPRYFDPNLTTQGGDNWANEQAFEQLVRPADGQFALTPEEYHPTLATEWSVSDDAKVWTFKLREGVQFHKGYGEMTSDDVVYSFERALKDGTNKANLANIESVTADGPYSVVIRLKAPDVNFLGTGAFDKTTVVVSKKAAEEKGESFANDAIGTGPYQLDKFDTNWGVALVRFDDYWDKEHIAKIPRVECVYIADTTARTLALLSKDVDMIEAVRAPGWVDSMKSQDPTLLIDMTVPGSFNTLHVNLTRPPFDNLKVRQALMFALDRNAVAQALAPMGGTMYGLQPDFFPAGLTIADVPEDLQYSYDPERAKALLAEAGFPDGFEFESNISQREDYSSTMLIVQEQIRKSGFNMKLKVMDHTAYHAANRSDQNTLAMHSSSYPPIPTLIYFQQLSSGAEVKADGSGGGNYSHYGVAMPGIDGLLAKALASTTYKDYLDYCNQIELQILRDLPLIGLSSLSFTVARNANVDLGYPVESGYARWRFHRATKTS
ncbi:MAG: ABC transporter substrate-binding protein [Geminicoccaceae bacterium]|nr:ABC transporter substrate-binding protein [Geminicoccaceae bacterium]